jgi:hypothetical protein
MVREVIQIGDKAKLKVGKENREWGYNPGPDDMEVEVVGFSEISYGRLQSYGRLPGVYENRCWPKVRFPDGHEDTISHCHLESDKSFWEIGESKRLRDLPETKFYEWDEVKVIGPRGCFDDKIVTGIDYEWMKQKRNDGSPMPHYRVSPDRSGGSYCSYGDSDLELVCRGPVWKYFHNEALVFASEMEEIQFFYALGHHKEVRNPRCDLYKWTLEEALESAKDGICDCLNVSGGLFGGTPHLCVIRFNDRELGERARKMFIREFSCVKS